MCFQPNYKGKAVLSIITIILVLAYIRYITFPLGLIIL